MRLQRDALDAAAASIACCASRLPIVIATSFSPGMPKRVPAPAASTEQPIEIAAFVRSRILRDDLDHLIVDGAVGRDEMAAVERKRFTMIAAHAAARFSTDQRACGYIPRVQARLPKSIEASAGDVAEIERRRSVAPDRARDLQEVA